MAIVPQQRPMSKQYTITMCVIYLVMAGYIVYRGYVAHRPVFYGLAVVLVLAAVWRLMRLRKPAPPPPPPDKKVELFSKPKDF